jgi:hypothetical protein
MRNHLAALLAAWLMLAAPPAAWSLTRLAEQEAASRLGAGDRLAASDGRAVQSAVDPYDDSVWIATDASLLLHFSRDGVLAQATTLSMPADALAVDLDQGVWLVSDGELLHFAADGRWLETRRVSRVSAEAASALAVDALRDRLWIATTRALYRAPRSATSIWAAIEMVPGETVSLALDPQSGGVLAIVDGLLVAFDGEGGRQPSFDNVLADRETPLTVLHDADERSFVIRTASGIVRVAHDGRVLQRVARGDHDSAEAAAAAAPFRIEPTLALLRPPDGGAVSEPYPELVLRIGTVCNGMPCEMPDGYLAGARIEATLDGSSLGAPLIEAAAARVTFPQRPALQVGVNRLSARLVDRFGHHASIERAQWTLMDARAGVEQASASATADALPGTAATKAANKSPTVLLTSPAGGAVFAAGTTIPLAATASDPDGSIVKVEFYRAGTTLIGTAATTPYRFDWTNVAAGSYSLTAKAYDNRNGTAMSATATIAVGSNQFPVVSLASPVNGAFFTVGSTIPLAATASDPDGTIVRVEFLDGGSLIGAVAAAPYALTWSAPASGLHSIVARAIDNAGGSSDSAGADIVVGDRPVVVVTVPAACAIIDGPLNLSLVADAMSSSGRIVSVQFFDGDALIGTATTAPWQTMLVNASAGGHSITAKATDDRGLTTTSRPSPFTVRAANQPPSVALVSPTEGARFSLGSTVSLAATAADPDGIITAVEYRVGSANGSLIGRATTPPYAASWINAAAGNYTLVAVAYDDRGAITTSGAVHVTVDPNHLPSVALTAPAVNATFTAPANIDISASAFDSDGTIAKVEFYVDATLIATATAAPLSAHWPNVGAGVYSITAKATDNLGGISTSTAIRITVISNALPTIALISPAPGTQYVAPAMISLSANAADSDGAVVRVEFYANGALIGSTAAPPHAIVWDGVAAGAYSLSVKAVDNQGATTTSPDVNVVVNVVVNAGLTIKAAPGLDGSIVDDDSVLVTGTMTGPANSGVLINGAIAQLAPDGHFYANAVPLAPGANTVTIVVSSPDGQSATQTVGLSSSGAAPFSVTVSPADGFAPLAVAFEVTNRANRGFQRIEFDLDGDGSSDYSADAAQFVDGVLSIATTFPAGTFVATIKIYDANNVVIYAATRAVTARTIQQHDALLTGVYARMLDFLQAGRIPAALNAVTGDMLDKYSTVFTALGSALPAAIAGLGSLQSQWFGTDRAEYAVIRDTPDGPQAFLIDFLRGEDGIWRIDAM